MAPCSSSLQHDVAVEQCVSWCRVQEAYHHCEWCKCRGCAFCAPPQSRTHVYATGDEGMVACDSGSVLQRGIEDDEVSLSECRETCDASYEAKGDGGCHSFTFSEMQRRCELGSAAGKPRKFCQRSGWQTHWRVEVSSEELLILPSSDDAAALAEGSGGNVSAGGGIPRRLQAHGARLIDTATGGSVVLHGVNMFVDYLEFDDISLLRQLLPAANVVRLVGVLWGDAKPDPNSNGVCAPSDRCCDEDAANGYLAPHCLASLALAVERLAAAGVWVVVALKGRFAAGEGWPSTPDVFHDSVLAARVTVLWRHVAHALRHLPRIAGYEVLSEPRNKHVAQGAVRSFYEGVCAAVHLVDPRVLCVVGCATHEVLPSASGLVH